MLDFTTGYVKRESKRVYSVAIVKYNIATNTFHLVRGGKKYKINPFEFDKVKVIYSLPSNDIYEAWTKVKANGLKVENFKYIANSWATVKPNMKVRGKIVDDKFIIKY